jgi:hypothetical protein
MPEFYSPSAAFGSGLEDYMRYRDGQAQKAFENKLAQQRIDIETKRQEAELENQLALRRESRERLDDMARSRVEKILATMEPGDILPSDVMEEAHRLHVPVRAQSATPAAPIQPAAPEGIAAPDQPAGDLGGASNTGVPAAPTPTTALPGGPIRFGGTFAQRKAVETDAKVKALQETIAKAVPGSPEFIQAVMQYEMTTGKTVPAGLLKGAGGDTEPIMRQNPTTGAVERLVNGKWIVQTGDAPKGTHFMTVPPPKDTSAKDARDQAHLDLVHQQTVKEWDDIAKPVKSHLDSANELTQILRMKTPVTDKLVSPLVLKAIIAGQGSGFRMTRAEIDNITHGRSRWEDLNVALNKWSSDPTQALDLSDQQREDLANSGEGRTRARQQELVEADGRAPRTRRCDRHEDPAYHDDGAAGGHAEAG